VIESDHTVCDGAGLILERTRRVIHRDPRLRVGLVWHRGMLLRKTTQNPTQKARFRRATTKYGCHLSFRPLGGRKNIRKPVTFLTRSQE
jgi:hypothetical protein